MQNNKQFYKGTKMKEVKKFYEKFDYNNKDDKQRTKYFNSHIDSFLSILQS